MAVPNSEAVQWLPSGSTSAESRSGRIGPISLEAKQTGERSAGNPHAAFDEAGAGNVARPRWCDTRRRKSEPTGNTNFGLNRRASPRPYRTPTPCAAATFMMPALPRRKSALIATSFSASIGGRPSVFPCASARPTLGAARPWITAGCATAQWRARFARRYPPPLEPPLTNQAFLSCCGGLIPSPA